LPVPGVASAPAVLSWVVLTSFCQILCVLANRRDWAKAQDLDHLREEFRDGRQRENSAVGRTGELTQQVIESSGLLDPPSARPAPFFPFTPVAPLVPLCHHYSYQQVVW